MPQIDATDPRVKEACTAILRALLSADAAESEQTMKTVKVAAAEWMLQWLT